MERYRTFCSFAESVPATAKPESNAISDGWVNGVKWGGSQTAAKRAKPAFARSNIGQEPMIACTSRAA
jgi:hypothetical protein